MKKLTFPYKTSKNIFFNDDLDIKVLDYGSNKEVQHFFSNMFLYIMIPTINKPTGVTRDRVTIINYIVTNTVISDIQHIVTNTSPQLKLK